MFSSWTDEQIRAVEVRIWSRVTKGDGVDSCWIWEGWKDKDGYGGIWVGGRNERVHRVVYALKNPVIVLTSVVFVCHKCDMPSCCRLDHLFIGDALSNNRDRMKKGRSGHGPQMSRRARGERHGMAKLSFDEVRRIRFMSQQGTSGRALAREFDMSRKQIGRIIQGASWADSGSRKSEKTNDIRGDRDGPEKRWV